MANNIPNRYFCTDCYHVGHYQDTVLTCKKCGSKYLARGLDYSRMIERKMKKEIEKKYAPKKEVVFNTQGELF